MSESTPRISLLVPFSSNESSRKVIWQHVRKWLRNNLDYPLYISDYRPEDADHFNHSLARNQAAHTAGDWDVAIFHDADTLLDPQQIRQAVHVAYKTGAVTYPYTERWELDRKGTHMLLTNEDSDWQLHLKLYTQTRPLGGCIIIRRDLWDMVRGFDTGFVGWGHEDGAFAIACEVLSGKKLIRIPGRSLHLEHIFSGSKNQESPIYLDNKMRINRYLQAMKKPNAKELIRNLRNESIKIDTAEGIMFSDT